MISVRGLAAKEYGAVRAVDELTSDIEAASAAGGWRLLRTGAAGPSTRSTPMDTATTYRLALALTVATAAFLVLAIGALGIIGAGGRPDRGYAAVLVVLLLGSVVARLRARGMALTLAATALTQVVVTLVVLLTGQHEVDGASSVDVLGITGMYAALFGGAGWLFRRSADRAPQLTSGRR